MLTLLHVHQVCVVPSLSVIAERRVIVFLVQKTCTGSPYIEPISAESSEDPIKNSSLPPPYQNIADKLIGAVLKK